MSDFNVPGSRPKKHDEISEIDRRPTPRRPGWPPSPRGCIVIIIIIIIQ